MPPPIFFLSFCLRINTKPEDSQWEEGRDLTPTKISLLSKGNFEQSTLIYYWSVHPVWRAYVKESTLCLEGALPWQTCLCSGTTSWKQLGCPWTQAGTSQAQHDLSSVTEWTGNNGEGTRCSGSADPDIWIPRPAMLGKHSTDPTTALQGFCHQMEHHSTVISKFSHFPTFHKTQPLSPLKMEGWVCSEKVFPRVIWDPPSTEGKNSRKTPAILTQSEKLI